jgi:hypothetical protein
MSKVLSPDELKRKQERFPKWQWGVGILGTVALIGSLVLAFFGWGLKVESRGIKIVQVFVLVFWTLAPPIWFWFEYVILFRRAFPHANENSLDALKTQQDLSSKIWIATTSALLILYFWKDIGGGK